MNNFDKKYFTMMKLINEDKNDYEFDYQLLDRLKSDCKYFLAHGNKNEDILWAGSQEEQIETMKQIWNELPEKPEWCTWEDILSLEAQLKEKLYFD
jgi:hypothetical protein